MKIFIFIIALLIAIQVGAEDLDRFESTAAEFSVVKPGQWQFVTAEQNLENLKRTEMDDEEFRQAMIKYSTAPLVAMMKYPEPFDDLNPSVKVNIKPLGEFKGADPKQILGLILPQLERVFDNFEVLKPPQDTIVSGHKSAYMRINYSLKIPDGRTFPTTSEMWIVPRGNYFFMIGAGTRQDEKTGTRAEIAKIISSIIL